MFVSSTNLLAVSSCVFKNRVKGRGEPVGGSKISMVSSTIPCPSTIV